MRSTIVHLLLLSGIGKPYDPRAGSGVVGRNYAYQITSGVDVFVDDLVNPFMGAGALGQVVDDWNGDNFDHGPHGFIGGGYIALWTTGGRPILQHHVPAGTPTWGSKWKRALAESYLHSVSIATHGSVMSYRDAYLDLDPTYRDSYGNPMLRMTFDFHDNEHRMSKFVTDKAEEIAKAMKARSHHVKERSGHYSIVPYQTTHNTGGAIMGDDPKTSVVNRYLQSWDVPNVFVQGAACSRRTRATTRPAPSAHSLSGVPMPCASICASPDRSCPRERRRNRSMRASSKVLAVSRRRIARRGRARRWPIRAARLHSFRRSCAVAIWSRPAIARRATRPRAESRSPAGDAIPTPFGTIYSSNITPDKETGIGNWSDDGLLAGACTMAGASSAAGSIRRCRYPWYTRLGHDDVLAIKAYLDTLPAVRNEVKPPDLPWPLSWRPVALLGVGRDVLQARRFRRGLAQKVRRSGTAARISSRAWATAAHAIRRRTSSAP